MREDFVIFMDNVPRLNDSCKHADSLDIPQRVQTDWTGHIGSCVVLILSKHMVCYIPDFLSAVAVRHPDGPGLACLALIEQ